jgi:endonuclease YncB( thermonuclease family)
MASSSPSIKVSIAAVLVAGIALGFFAGRLSIDPTQGRVNEPVKPALEAPIADSKPVSRSPSARLEAGIPPSELPVSPNGSKPPQPPGLSGADKSLSVGRIIDGDTVEVHYRPDAPIRERVRLLRIDTPERGQPLYSEAKAELDLLMASGAARLEFEPKKPRRDRYGRLLVYLFVDDKLVNVEMVRRGLSKHYTKYGVGIYEKQFVDAQAEAKANHRGLWAPSSSSTP